MAMVQIMESASPVLGSFSNGIIEIPYSILVGGLEHEFSWLIYG